MRLRPRLRPDSLLAAVTIAYFLALAPVTPGMASGANLANLFSNLLPLLVITLGQTFVLITGGIDLSVTSIVALSSVTGAAVMTSQGGLLAGSPWAAPAGVLAMLLTGAALGAVNGLAVTRLEMPAFIVTLTSMMFFSGLAVWLTRSRNIDGLPGAFTGLAGAPALLVAAAVAAASWWILRRTTWGRRMYAVGMNPRACRVSGVPVERVTLSAYLMSGLLASVAAALYTARLETGSPVLGQRIFLDVIAAAVIGGTSLFGGRGTVRGTILGVAFITLLDNSLNLLGLSFFLVLMAKGSVILAAALLDRAAARASEEA